MAKWTTVGSPEELASLVDAGVACGGSTSTRTQVIHQDPPEIDPFTPSRTDGESTPPGSRREFDAVTTIDGESTGSPRPAIEVTAPRTTGSSVHL
jgi:hypothetical protein